MFVLLKWLVICIVGVIVLTYLFLRFAPTFGGLPDSDTQARINASPNFDGNTFVNLTSTNASTIDLSTGTASEQASEGNVLWQFIFPPKGKNPSEPVQSQKLNLLNEPLTDGEFVWLGHSTVLFKTAGKTLITDPVFHRASPLPIGGKPFAYQNTPTVADLPNVDAVLISHDHYDHLDHKAIAQINAKTGHFYVPLGVKSHLMRWGVPSDKISEFDWYESVKLDDVELTFTPTRHFSGRRLTGHRTTLWGSWAVVSPDLSVYFSGDGGYSPEFANIGERFGGFDVAFIEDGAYNERWRDVHMLPEESAQAGFDLKAKVVLPIHWGKFDLSMHEWREPIRRITQAVHQGNANRPANEQITLATPSVGQVFDLDDLPNEAWWEDSQH